MLIGIPERSRILNSPDWKNCKYTSPVYVLYYTVTSMSVDLNSLFGVPISDHEYSPSLAEHNTVGFPPIVRRPRGVAENSIIRRNNLPPGMHYRNPSVGTRTKQFSINETFFFFFLKL